MSIFNFTNNISNVALTAILIVIVLVISTITIWILRKAKPNTDWSELSLRIRSWWIMSAVFFLSILIDKRISLVLFGLLSFWAMKEYFTILETRRADHIALFFSFLAIPFQYYWAGIGWYGMFIVFIPVYMFLFLPVLLILAKEVSGFLYASSRIHWGLMAFVFGLSHLGYLLKMPQISNKAVNGQTLLLFLVIVTEMNDIFQYIWGRTIGGKKILPTISPKKTWAGFIGGILTTPVFSLFLIYLTPFKIWQCLIFVFLISIVGFCGDVVMSAVKRDAKVKDFGDILPGHGGMLDRVDSLCYTVPVFFHIVRYFWY